jgi:hypothetical protein
MNSNKIFAPLGPRERRCKLHEKPHRVDVMIGVSVSACLPPARARPSGLRAVADLQYRAPSTVAAEERIS